jgi:hypothetical protein
VAPRHCSYYDRDWLEGCQFLAFSVDLGGHVCHYLTKAIISSHQRSRPPDTVFIQKPLGGAWFGQGSGVLKVDGRLEKKKSVPPVDVEQIVLAASVYHVIEVLTPPTQRKWEIAA